MSLRRDSRGAEKYHIGSPPSDSPLSDEEDVINYPIMESSDSDTPDDDDVQTVMVFFRRMYEDPQQDLMEMLDGLAGEVLRTGKISVAGSAGGEYPHES